MDEWVDACMEGLVHDDWIIGWVGEWVDVLAGG